MSRAICVRCGASRPAFDAACTACGHRPEGEGLLVAWLLSSEHLPDDALDRAAERIRRGEPVRASDRMLDAARRALGRHHTTDAGLARPVRLALLAGSTLFTALPGLVLWWWWRQDRPRSATHALWMSLPAGVLGWVVIAWAWLSSVLPPG